MNISKILKISRENSAYQYAETLKRNRVKRQRHGEFFVEGVKSINQAIKFGWDISAFYYTKAHPMGLLFMSGDAEVRIQDPKKEFRVTRGASIIRGCLAKIEF